MNAATRRWGLLLAALLLSALTARLGWWQLDRAAQKTQLQRALENQRARPALLLANLGPLRTEPEPAADTAELLHRRVRLQGRWLPEHSVYLDNRQMNGRTGFYAVTPLLLDDGSAVLVQRGWMPRDLLDRTRIQPAPLPQGLVWMHGRLAATLSRTYEISGGGADQANLDENPIRQNLDLQAYASATRLRIRPLPVVQTSGADAAADGLLRDWPAPATGVEKHWGYAFQWFALSALIAGLWLWFGFIRPRAEHRTRSLIKSS